MKVFSSQLKTRSYEDSLCALQEVSEVEAA